MRNLVGKNVPSLHQSWYSLSLIETLLRLAEVENYAVVRQMFNYPIKHCPELLSIGLAQSKVPRNTPESISHYIIDIMEHIGS